MKRIFCILLMLVLAMLIVVCTFFYSKECIEDKEQEVIFDNISEVVENGEQSSNENKYAKLHQENNDFIGWIEIPDTNINYPVMQTKEAPEYYLYKNFKKEYSRYGTPFLQANCDMHSSDNLIIYAHNMKTKAMFHDLTLFTDDSFYSNHRLIHFSTQESEETYEIFAIIKTTAYSSDSFDYFSFVKASDENEFTEYVKKCKSLSLYDTGMSAEYGDKLLTLSTCEYSTANGRLVVVARKV